MRTLQRTWENFNLSAPVRFEVPLAEYTTFRVGGPAEALVFPRSSDELTEVLRRLADERIPVTILGGGANVVISDRGIRGVVVHTGGLNRLESDAATVYAGAGRAISEVAAFAADLDLVGLEWIYAMPGSVGGAVWMNARCYGGEIAEVIGPVSFVTLEGTPGRYTPDPGDFAYKVSPFQSGGRIITEVTFHLTDSRGAGGSLWERMREIEADRREKGHFDAPCAGSIFKNDRRYGEPSGRIIDRLGLRGLRRGGALISPKHGNIIINTGGATAREIRDLVTEVSDRVYGETGFRLDPEVLFLGEWS
ncbi:MAG: UDP-N-acetylmuramate dehydrogenase [Alkalispirochaeta sp.]